MKMKAFIAILVISTISLTGTALALAEEATLDEIPTAEEIPEEIPEASPEISEDVQEPQSVIVNDKYRPEIPFILIDTVNYDYNDENGTPSVDSVADISKYVGQELYYPQYGMKDSNYGFISVLYNQRYYAAHGDKTESGEYNNLQFNAMGDIVERFWIDINYTNSFYEEMPDDIFYESHGTTFLIRKNTWAEDDGDYYVKGALEGSTYSFTTDSIENAKLVIDSLVKQ